MIESTWGASLVNQSLWFHLPMQGCGFNPWSESLNPRCFATKKYKTEARASLMVQWLRICLAMWGTPVQSLVGEDPICLGETKPTCHNYWACALESENPNSWAHHATAEAQAPRACAPPQAKPLQWEAVTPQLESSPQSPQLEKVCMQQWRPTTAK